MFSVFRRHRTIGILIMVIPIASLAACYVAGKVLYVGPFSLQSSVYKIALSAFPAVNERLKQEYGFIFPQPSTGYISCWDSKDPFSGQINACQYYIDAVPVTADDAFISRWQQSSPGFEHWLLQNGWIKSWNAAQPIATILDKPQNPTSIGVNYAKLFGHVSCTVSVTWVQPHSPNRLNASERCNG